MPSDLVHLYMRIDHLPQMWCPGCGNGVIMRDVAVAIDELIHDEESGVNREDIVIVSGIGCSSRAAGYLDFNSIHTTHGRAIAFASGIKMANPRLHVIVLTGDGDCSAIGGNHLIHAARRNLGLTVIAFNNDIYGMTGGQYSPTTPNGDKATTAPYCTTPVRPSISSSRPSCTRASPWWTSIPSAPPTTDAKTRRATRWRCCAGRRRI